MLTEFLLLLLILLLIAAILKGGFVLSILYFLLGGYLLGWWLTQQAWKKITYHRSLETRAFSGEEIPVRLEVRNTGWLPVPWLYLFESIPVEFAAGQVIKRVVSLHPHKGTEISYVLHANKRGYYSVGPLFTLLGDTVGLVEARDHLVAPDHITVYPRIIPLTHPALPSQSPQGTLRHHRPVFEDPSRVIGKREYTTGDSLRRVDWKTSAAVGRLQVKQYEPSIALGTVIFLNLDSTEIPSRALFDSTELAVVIAASLANWIITKKQAVGLITNGINPISEERSFKPIASRKGRDHLMRILDILARVQIAENRPFTEALRKESPLLPWGTTLIIITSQINEALFDELFQIRRRGQNIELIVAGRGVDATLAREKANHFGFPVHLFQNERALDIWRQ